MASEAEKLAEELLPCIGQGWISSHEILCPPELPSCVLCVKRPAVAAALEAKDKEIERLKAEIEEAGRHALKVYRENKAQLKVERGMRARKAGL